MLKTLKREARFHIFSFRTVKETKGLGCDCCTLQNRHASLSSFTSSTEEKDMKKSSFFYSNQTP